MKKTMALAYGVLAYFAFFGTILYMIGFVGGFAVPKAINDGAPGSFAMALMVNVGLVLAFGVQHSVMARPAFKEWWTQYISKAVERSTFVLLSSVILAMTFLLWKPMPMTIWMVESMPARSAIYFLYAMGWFLVFYSSFLINHFDLFGLRQVFLYFKNKSYSPVPVKVVSLYRFVRNPLMLGFAIAIWATPHMTVGHLVFATSMSAYILIGVYFEERTLMRELGNEYREYHNNTPMLIPVPKNPARRIDGTSATMTMASSESR
jgi:methanethiol S-methyltransferase